MARVVPIVEPWPASHAEGFVLPAGALLWLAGRHRQLLRGSHLPPIPFARHTPNLCASRSRLGAAWRWGRYGYVFSTCAFRRRLPTEAQKGASFRHLVPVRLYVLFEPLG